MKRVHIIGSGGPAGIGMTRCLKDYYEVSGEDSSAWASLMSECSVPEGFNVDAVIAVPDGSVSLSSFRPPREHIELCRDKAKTAEMLGDLAPKTYWIRDTVGAGGSGAQMASELLPGRNFSHEFVYFNGDKLADFQKERISYAVKGKTEGLENRGSSAVSVCRLEEGIYSLASEAMLRLSLETGKQPHGFYGVDIKCDADGRPKVTEINAGRLLTASYSYFWLTGYNLPLVGIRAFLGEEPPELPPYPTGYGIIRQTDQLPKLFPPEITKGW